MAAPPALSIVSEVALDAHCWSLGHHRAGKYILKTAVIKNTKKSCASKGSNPMAAKSATIIDFSEQALLSKQANKQTTKSDANQETALGLGLHTLQ